MQSIVLYFHVMIKDDYPHPYASAMPDAPWLPGASLCQLGRAVTIKDALCVDGNSQSGVKRGYDWKDVHLILYMSVRKIARNK